MVTYLPLIVALLGAVFYVLCAHAKPVPNTTGAELGRLAWLAGLLAFLLRLSELPIVHVGPR